jgi:hypothetical protein
VAGRLRDAAALLAPAVDETIAALSDLTGADTAAVRLARQYARTIDSCARHCDACDDPACGRETATWAMRWIAPLLLAALEQLGATPAARARIKGGKPDAPPQGQLAKLRATRRA